MVLRGKSRFGSATDTMYTPKTRSRQISPVQAHYDEPKRQTKRESYKEFAEASTTHGIYYAFERDARAISHLFWFVICVILFGLAGYLIAKQYMAWKDDPMLTTVASTGHAVSSLTFPAVTVCSLGLVDGIMDSAFKAMLGEYADFKNVTGGIDTSQNVSDIVEELKDKHGLDPWEDLFPGVTINPQVMIRAMASRNADEFIRSEISVNGYDACSTILNTTADPNAPSGPTCGVSGTVLDAANEVCYGLLGGSRDQEMTVDGCADYGSYGGWLVDFSSDAEVTGFISVIKADSTFATFASGTRFWSNFFQVEDGSYENSEGNLLSEFNFTKIVLPAPKPSPKRCATLRYNSTVDKLVLEPESCHEASHPSICGISADVPLQCDANGQSTATLTDDDEEWLNSTLLDKMIDPKLKSQLSSTYSAARKAYRESFRSIDIEKAYPNMFQLLWYSQLPCFDTKGFSSGGYSSILKKCWWKGKAMDCSAIFDVFPTDRGMCCTFNMHKAQDLFEKSEYTDFVLEMQKRDKGDAYDNPNLPAWYVSKGEPRPHQGVTKGLRIILDAHTDQLASSSVSEDFRGFIAIVNNRNSFPLTALKNIRIRPGHENLVAIEATDVIATKHVKDIDLQHRACYFEDEYKLKLHKNYSQSSCVMECMMEYAMAKMGDEACTPWFLPIHNKSMTMCDPWGARKFLNWTNDVTTECDKCLPDCQGTTYETTVTAVPFRQCDNKNLGVSFMCDLDTREQLNPPIFGASVYEEYKINKDEDENGIDDGVPTYVTDKWTESTRYVTMDKKKEVFTAVAETRYEYDAYEQDIAIANFYFESSTAFQYKRQARMLPGDFLSQVGGLLGLCIGFSFCSAVEIVYWFLIRIPFGCKKQRERSIDK